MLAPRERLLAITWAAGFAAARYDERDGDQDQGRLINERTPVLREHPDEHHGGPQHYRDADPPREDAGPEDSEAVGDHGWERERNEVRLDVARAAGKVVLLQHDHQEKHHRGEDE